MEHHIQISAHDVELSAVLHYPTEIDCAKQQSRWPLIIICHGFIGNKIGVDRLFIKAAREFSSNGFMVLRFDYGGCGESTGDYGAGGLDHLVEQTRRVIDYGLDIDCVDPKQVILLGHSLGGAVSILTAARDSRVKTLVLWSAVLHPFNDILRIVGKKVYEQANLIGNADYLGYSFTAHFFESLSKQQPYKYVNKFHGDVLLIHGTSDDVIPVDYCFQYQRVFWLRPDGQCDKEVIFEADHTYSTQESANQAVEKTIKWLKFIEKRKQEWNDWAI